MRRGTRESRRSTAEELPGSFSLVDTVSAIPEDGSANDTHATGELSAIICASKRQMVIASWSATVNNAVLCLVSLPHFLHKHVRCFP